MELIHGVNCIKGETHALITLMRLNTRWANRSSRRAHKDSYYYHDDEDPFIQSFRQLNEYLEGLYDLEEVDCLKYIAPFHEIIISEQTSGPLTSAALSALSKFALYGFFNAQYPNIQEAMVLVADSISHCIFEETDWESDELILMKLLELSALCFRSNAAALLSVQAAWDIYTTCISIYNHYRASKILKSEAETALVHLTLNIFMRASAMVRSQQFFLPPADRQTASNGPAAEHCYNTDSQEAKLAERKYFAAEVQRRSKLQHDVESLTLAQPVGITLMLLKITTVVSEMLDLPNKNNVDGIKFALFLINVALEAGGSALNLIQPLVDILRNDICRHLLRATQSDDLAVFSLTLRVVFNLFMSIKEHMKIQLEVFLTSVHLRILDPNGSGGNGPFTGSANNANVSLSLAREELVLESLLEFCREPTLMQDLYTNYDCDVQCTNLFDTIIAVLCKRATLDIGTLAAKPADDTSPRNSAGKVEGSTKQSTDRSKATARITILHRLAFDGVLAILHSMVGKSQLQQNLVAERVSRATSSTPVSVDFMSLDTMAKEAPNTAPQDVVIEAEIDKWCESAADADFLTQEDFEVYSFINANTMAQSPVKSPSLLQLAKDSQPMISYPSSPTVATPSSSSPNSPYFQDSSKSTAHRRYSESSISSNGSISASIIDRENECTNSLEAKQKAAEELRQRKSMKQKMKHITEQFNAKPLKFEWIKAAIDTGMIAVLQTAADGIDNVAINIADVSSVADIDSIAKFLKTIPGLGRTQIGEFISKGPADLYPFHAKVLKAYVNTFDFSGNKGSFDRALRLFLSYFRLPGEAQCIDRLMEAFAGRFFEQLGPGKPFASSDAVFILSFSTIMLNTDMHNPNIAANKKMTKEEFIRNNRGINDGKDLPKEYLENIYDEIKTNQIQVDIDMADAKVVVDFTDSATWNKLIDRSSFDQAPAVFTPTSRARKLRHGTSSTCVEEEEDLCYEMDMFLVMAKPSLEAMIVLWESTMDDMLLRRLMQGMHDYLTICLHLNLRNALSSAIRVLLRFASQHMQETRSRSRKSYSRMNILSNRVSYDQWASESGHDLEALVRASMDQLTKHYDILSTDSRIAVDWTEAVLVKGELLVRVIANSIRTSAHIHKQSFASLFAWLMWVRSRGALPQSLSRMCNYFPVLRPSASSLTKLFPPREGEGEDEEESESPRIRYRPSQCAKQCFQLAFGAELWDESSAHSAKGRNNTQPTSWISNLGGLLWSGSIEEDESFMHRSASPAGSGANLLLSAALASSHEEEDRIFTNLNASSCLDQYGSHVRSDDFLLQRSLEMSGLEQLLAQTFEGNDTQQMQTVLAGILLPLAKALEVVTKRSFDSILWTDSFENRVFEGSLPLSDIFPSYLLQDDDVPIPSQVAELDVVFIFELFVKSVCSNANVWKLFSAKLRDILNILIGEYADVIIKHLPYLFERCVVTLMQCILRDIAPVSPSMQVPATSAMPSSAFSCSNTFWSMMRLLRELPSETLVQLSGVLGAGLLAVVKTIHHFESEVTLDQWYLLFSLLSSIWMGWEGRCRVWEIISYLIHEDLITDLNYTPCRHLLLKYLDRSLMLADDGSHDSAKTMEKTYKEMRANQQEWSSNAMLYLLKLTLMAMAGYVQHRNAPSSVVDGKQQASSMQFKETFPPTPVKKRTTSAPSFAAHDDPTRVKNSPTVCRVKSNHSHAMTFPDADAFTAQLFSPSKFDKRDTDQSEAEADIAAAQHGHPKVDERKTSAPNWLTVSSIQFEKEEEVESLWLSTVVLFADYCNIPSLPVIHRAEYCLEVLISAGNISFLPVQVWFHCLDELISHMPIGLVSSIGRMTTLAQSEVNEVCCRCCNIIFHVLVFHIKELRKQDHFVAMYIRAISAMSGNASISQKGMLIHEEMLGMVIALLRLLRLPQLVQQQSPPIVDHKVADPAVEAQANGNNSAGLFGVLQWIISSPPPTPAVLPTTVISKGEEPSIQATTNSLELVSEDHDGTLLLLSWKAIFSLYPGLPLLIKSWDIQLFKSLHQAMELTEQLRIAHVNKAIKAKEVHEAREKQPQISPEVNGKAEPGHTATVQPKNIAKKITPAVAQKENLTPVSSTATSISVPAAASVEKSKPLPSPTERIHTHPTPIDITTVHPRRTQHQDNVQTTLQESKPVHVIVPSHPRMKLDPKSPVQIV